MAAGDIKLAYASSAALTFTLTSLASDTNLVAGRQSTVVDNTTNLYRDYLISGVIKANNTAPTAARLIEIWAFGMMEDTPSYPDTLGATDANVTLTTLDIKGAGLNLASVISTDATANRLYYMKPTSLAMLFGGLLPKKWGLYVVHNMGQALNVTSGHAFYQTGVYDTVA